MIHEVKVEFSPGLLLNVQESNEKGKCECEFWNRCLGYLFEGEIALVLVHYQVNFASMTVLLDVVFKLWSIWVCYLACSSSYRAGYFTSAGHSAQLMTNNCQCFAYGWSLQLTRTHLFTAFSCFFFYYTITLLTVNLPLHHCKHTH